MRARYTPPRRMREYRDIGSFYFGFWIADFGLKPIQNPQSKIQMHFQT